MLKDGDVLLLQAPVDAIRGFQPNNDLVLLEELEKAHPPPIASGWPCCWRW